jgi:hypothetical protein
MAYVTSELPRKEEFVPQHINAFAVIAMIKKSQ